MPELNISFAHERDTKRMYRYKEESEEPVMGTLYISKEAFEQRPERIQVTVKALE